MTSSHRGHSESAAITVRMREDWLTEVKLADEDEPIVLAPGDVLTIDPRADVVVHRQMPPHASAGTQGQENPPA